MTMIEVTESFTIEIPENQEFTSKEIVTLWDGFHRLSRIMLTAKRNNDKASYVEAMHKRREIAQQLSAAGHFNTMPLCN